MSKAEQRRTKYFDRVSLKIGDSWKLLRENLKPEQKNNCFSLISVVGLLEDFCCCDSNWSLIKTTCDGILKLKNSNFDIWFRDNWEFYS